MNRVTILVASLDELQCNMEEALQVNKQQQGSYITFLDWESL